MKKCKYCGCINKDDRVVCVDCEHSLSGSEEVDEKDIRTMINDINQHADLFIMKPRNWNVFYLSIALLIGNIVLIIFRISEPSLAFLAMVFAVFSLIEARFKKTVWKIEQYFLSFRYDGDISPTLGWFINYDGSMIIDIVVSIIITLWAASFGVKM